LERENRHFPSERALQEYLEALSSDAAATPESAERPLHSFAELNYRRDGAKKCALCTATVRHAIPVRAVHKDGATQDYPCLCTRCTEAE